MQRLLFIPALCIIFFACESSGDAEINDNCEAIRVSEKGRFMGNAVIRLSNESDVEVSEIKAEFDFFLRWEQRLRQGDGSGTKTVENLTVSADRLKAGERSDEYASVDFEHNFYPEIRVESAKVECNKE